MELRFTPYSRSRSLILCYAILPLVDVAEAGLVGLLAVLLLVPVPSSEASTTGLIMVAGLTARLGDRWFSLF